MTDPVRNLKSQVLSSDWSRFEKYTFEFRNPEGTWEIQQREVYDRGDGAVVLLYNPDKQSVVLTRQFRLPTFLNGNQSGLMIEACAGALEGEDPQMSAIREAREETGYSISAVEKVFEVYMSPGSVTEKLYFYIARYQEDDQVSGGGGLDTEQEYIEVMELPFDQAFCMIGNGEIRDAKTIMLLQHLKISRLMEG
ncbi:GDP-mannose pyrophosphatase NudK [Microbulbifer aggregans]|uniref:GDP-mannose pyrophosphatase n=1 Tax=Microbulbifer aggregans TaxID=1769779 RepID=A0A1C9WBX6_9GAMM|nr:NUDIX domain-containing protein [Microbulbifer aggregans]AOS98648.1 GDP-mannose pyrophosphatase NudK [Microbulbifer aggregans]